MIKYYGHWSEFASLLILIAVLKVFTFKYEYNIAKWSAEDKEI